MAWFRNLIQLSTIAKQSSSSINPKFTPTPHLALTGSFWRFSTQAEPNVSRHAGLGPTKPDEKPRVVVVGSGWAGCRLMKGIDTKLYDVVCVSPRNHMVFTPLLASTCVGTLEFRSVAEPIGRIQPAISREPGSYFFLSNCTSVDTDNHVLHCQTVTDGADALDPWNFKISYDKLVIAVGSQPLTFGIKGVTEHATFLREVYHAQEIRRKLLLNLMLSDVPGVTEEEKSRLLHCVVVGGGPTGVEFSGELSDFIIRDIDPLVTILRRALNPQPNLMLMEPLPLSRGGESVDEVLKPSSLQANEILSSFDDRLRRYATKQLEKSGVRLVRGVVKDVQSQKIILNDGTDVPYGLLVWSTGVGPSPFVKNLELPKAPGGRIGVDEWMRVPSAEDVFSIGDCSGFLESTGRPVLPALAQVAERQGKYLANLLNRMGKASGGHAKAAKDIDLGAPFVYKHLGSMATIGRFKALVDLRQSKEAKGLSIAGFASWFIWRSAYLTRVVSWRNRFYVAINWATTFIFGRDISRI